MEKYCKNCGRVFDDLNFKLCPYCGGELATRYGRQPIPRKLRHEVFKRDGYRCRECGASKDETSLEIDHIVPVAKGGTNDIDNLQTLCRECNRMKHTDEWVGGETDLEVAENELEVLKEQLRDVKTKLTQVSNEDDEIECQFKIVKLNEAINKVKDKIEILIQIQYEEQSLQEEKEKKDKLFKRFYVKLDEDSVQYLCLYYDVENKSQLITLLIDDFESEEEIFEFINQKVIEEEHDAKVDLFINSPVDLEFLLTKMSISYDLNLSPYDDKTEYWIDNYSLRELKTIVRNIEKKIMEDKKEFIEKEKLFKNSPIFSGLLVKEIYKDNNLNSSQNLNLIKDNDYDSIRYYFDKDIAYLIDNYSFEDLKVMVDDAEKKIIDAKVKRSNEIVRNCHNYDNDLQKEQNEEITQNHNFKDDDSLSYRYSESKKYGEKVNYAKELQHKRLGPNSHYKRCPLCKMLVNKNDDRCKYCKTNLNDIDIQNYINNAYNLHLKKFEQGKKRAFLAEISFIDLSAEFRNQIEIFGDDSTINKSKKDELINYFMDNYTLNELKDMFD